MHMNDTQQQRFCAVLRAFSISRSSTGSSYSDERMCARRMKCMQSERPTIRSVLHMTRVRPLGCKAYTPHVFCHHHPRRPSTTTHQGCPPPHPLLPWSLGIIIGQIIRGTKVADSLNDQVFKLPFKLKTKCQTKKSR